VVRPDAGAVDHLQKVGVTVAIGHARERVAAAIDALGGPASPAGACVWHVVGLECSVTEWARRSGWGGRPIGHAQGQGVLVSALGVLAGHYGLAGQRAA
jgi:hypothetical protein